MSAPPTAARITRGGGTQTLTFGTVVRRGSYWLIEAEPHVLIRLKRWFAKIDKISTGEQRLRRSVETDRDLQTFLDRFPMEMTPEDQRELHAGAERHRAEAKLVQKVLAGDYVPRAFELGVTPREYQRVAADLWLRRKTMLLADDLGLGKTISAITGLSDPATRPALIVTMPHITEQWKREVERCLTGTRVHILEGTRPYDLVAAADKEDRKAGRRAAHAFPDVVVTNYHRIAGWVDALPGKVKSIVFDEVQELRHEDTGRYQAAVALRKQAEFCIGLSATPINNYGGEFFNVLDIIEPGCLGTMEEFDRDWTTGSDKKKMVSDPRAFGYYLRESGRMLRRTRQEVGRELPKLTTVPFHIDAEIGAIDSIAGRAGELARAILGRGPGRGSNFDLMQASGDLDRLIRQATGVAKAPHVAAFVRMQVEMDQKVLLFGWHRTFWDIIAEQLEDLGPVFFTGNETTKTKGRSFDDFLRPSGSPVLCMSLRAGSAGLDGLQHVCKTAVVGELDWSPAVHDQGIGRLHRDGQREGVFAYWPLAAVGSDPIIADVCGVKRGQADPVRDPDSKMVMPTVDPQHVKRLAEAWLQTHGKR